MTSYEALDSIRNVYCIGRNYGRHAAELGNAVPDSPMVFMKPTHALVPMDGRLIELPSEFGAVHYEAELVVRISDTYRTGRAAAELIDGFALGLDLTLRELQDELKERQYPWLKAKGFRASAPITAFQPIDTLDELAEESFTLKVGGEERQRGHIRDMIFDLQTLVDHIGTHYGLQAGDVIFTGTPAGVGPVRDRDVMQLAWGSSVLGTCGFAYGS